MTINLIPYQKNDLRIMTFQSVRKKEGAVAGLCEITMIIPAELPHYVRV